MNVRVSHFKVHNGDMALFELGSGRRILTDINIRDPETSADDIADVADQLRKKLDRDDEGRLYVDAFLNTHPDADHIRGLETHFHLGGPDNWSEKDDKILIREMWSSPIVFRRASADHVLCADATAWCTEARRRVKKFRDEGAQADGNKILILGEDVDGKTDDLGDILVKVDGVFSKIGGDEDNSFEARLLAPMHADDDDEEELLTKNNSSVVMRLDLKVSGVTRCHYLLGGDAEVAIWEKLWERNKDNFERLQYDVLLAPHHCSWHSLSWDSWSEKGEDAVASSTASKALSQALSGAMVIASSKLIDDDEDDPPCIRAKREYEAILKDVSGEFKCVADGATFDPLEIEVSAAGSKVKRAVFATSVVAGMTGLGGQPFAHGSGD